MKPIFLSISRQRSIVCGLLLALLFSGTGTLSGLPLFYAAVAHAHPVFVAEENHKLRLTFHHPGNRDRHENALSASLQHRHDFFDQAFSFSNKGEAAHRDHVIEIPAFESQDLTLSKSAVVNAQRVADLQVMPLLLKAETCQVAQHAPPGIPFLSACIRSTILRI